MHYYHGDSFFPFFNTGFILLVIVLIVITIVVFRLLGQRNRQLDEIERKLDEINQKLSKEHRE